MNKIYSVGFDVDIIDYLADALLKEKGSDVIDLSSVAIVFPGRRPQFYLRKALANRIKRTFLPPKIFSIEDFIQYTAKEAAQLNQQQGSSQPICQLDAWFLIYKIIQNLKLSYLDWQKQLELEHFFLWARKIFQFLEELDKELIPEKQLLNLQDNAQIGLPLPDYINQLLGNINQIHKEFHKLLEENNLTTQGNNYYQVASSIGNIRLDEFKKIYFTGFFALNACEKRIIKHLLDKESAILIWQRDKDKWPIFEELEEFFAAAVHSVSEEEGAYPKIQIYEAFDTHSQIEAVKGILLNIKDLEDTCVVLPQSGALMPLLYQALPSNLTDYNISLGYPIKRTPIYALMDIIIQALERRRQDGSFYTKDYLRVIMHPYIKNIGDEEMKPDITRVLIHKIEETLLGIDKTIGRQKKAFIKLEEIEEDHLIFQVVSGLISVSFNAQFEPSALRRRLKQIHQKLLNAFDNCSTFFDFAQATGGIIYFVLEKSKVFSDVFSGEVFNRFLTVLDNLGQSLFKDEAIRDKTAFFELLKICLFFEKIPFQGTPVRGLQILGLLETRNLKFKNLIILDLNEGVLPKTDKGESLIPEGIFPVLGLPHYHKKEQIMRYHFRRLIGAAQNVFLIYASCSKNRESRSRFIEEIIWQEEKRNGKLYAPERIKRIEFRVVPDKQGFSLKKTPQALKILKRAFFSPTSLDKYLHCPAQFYFRYCLGLEEKEDIPEELEAADIGNFFHGLLRDFYSQFLNKTVKLDEQARKYLFEIKEKKFKEFFPQQTGERFLLSRIVDHKLKIFLDREINRKEKIKILCLEQKLPVKPQEVKISTEYGSVFLKGTLDRVDERVFGGKGRIVILDYKTGQIKLPRKAILRTNIDCRERIKKAIGSFQLPLYIHLFCEFNKKIPPSEVWAGYYSLREIKEEFLFADNNPADLFEINMAAVKRIISEILNPNVDFERDDSDEYYCRWCPFSALCKR
ncbi:MAG: PD-(D/E)XK nuclease family protein [Candidatus Omnitrophota bacterium]